MPPCTDANALTDAHRPVEAGQGEIIDLATEDALGAGPAAEPDEGKDPAAVALGRKGGLKGGKARAAKMSRKARQEAARHAALARWKRKKRKVPKTEV